VTDKEPNVQTAALDALFRLHHPDVIPNAIAILNTAGDFQVLRMSAMVLKGIDDERKPAASAALLDALRRLTDGQKRHLARSTRSRSSNGSRKRCRSTGPATWRHMRLISMTRSATRRSRRTPC
jgi:HEAT repeat protein